MRQVHRLSRLRHPGQQCAIYSRANTQSHSRPDGETHFFLLSRERVLGLCHFFAWQMEPTSQPTAGPTLSPTAGPTAGPTAYPTYSPAYDGTFVPTTENPTAEPTTAPTRSPTAFPTYSPAYAGTFGPTPSPTPMPTTVRCQVLT